MKIPTISLEQREKIKELRDQIIEKIRNTPAQGVEVEYLGRKFLALPTVFWPHDDSKPLVENFVIQPGERVLDLCTGSGVIAVHAALKGARVVATDINPVVIENVTKNAERFGVEDLIETRISDVFSAIGPAETFDVITCNPPFTDEPAPDFSTGTMRDPGLHVHRELFDGLVKHLVPDGRVYISQANFGNVHDMLELARKHGFSVNLIGTQKTENDPREFYAFELRKHNHGKDRS